MPSSFELDSASGRVVVPGATPHLVVLEQVESAGRYLPVDTLDSRLSTAEVAAANAHGPRSRHYGLAADWSEGVAGGTGLRSASQKAMAWRTIAPPAADRTLMARAWTGSDLTGFLERLDGAAGALACLDVLDRAGLDWIGGRLDTLAFDATPGPLTIIARLEGSAEGVARAFRAVWQAAELSGCGPERYDHDWRWGPVLPHRELAPGRLAVHARPAGLAAAIAVVSEAAQAAGGGMVRAHAGSGLVRAALASELAPEIAAWLRARIAELGGTELAS